MSVKNASDSSTRQSITLHPIPLDLAWQNPQENWVRMKRAVLDRLGDTSLCDPSGKNFFVFPELTLTGFTTQSPESTALEPHASIHEEVREFCRHHQIALAYGYPERHSAGKVRNILSVISPEGREVAHYAKIHLFTAGQPPEAETYEAGESGSILSLWGWTIGLGVCFDLRFPELFRAYAQQGCDLLILSACWLGGPTKKIQFKALSQAQAILTQSYFLGLNRSGSDPFAHYEGEALVYGPRGEVLLDADQGMRSVQISDELLTPARRLPILASLKSSYPNRKQL